MSAQIIKRDIRSLIHRVEKRQQIRSRNRQISVHEQHNISLRHTRAYCTANIMPQSIGHVDESHIRMMFGYGGARAVRAAVQYDNDIRKRKFFQLAQHPVNR
ncbi:hypothetical protein D3C78_1721110 [compost metagenome]